MPQTEREKLLAELEVTTPDQIEYINMLIYGKPGSGKTHFLGTALDRPETSPLLILDIDGGTLTLRKRKDCEVVKVRSIKEVVKWHDTLLNKNDVLGYKTVAIDTGSELAKLDMREIMIEAHNANPTQHIDVPSPREWGIAGEHMRRIVRAYRDLPMNFFMTAHLDERPDELKIMRNHPMFAGKLRVEIAGFLDIVGLLHTTIEGEKAVRHLQVEPTARSTAKDRTGSLGSMLDNPTVPMLWDLINA